MKAGRYDLDALRLNASGKRLDANLIDSVVDTSWERTIEGASTITFILDDPEGDLAESALLTRWAWGDGDLGEDDWIARGRRVDVRIGKEVYRLVKVNASGTQVTLTFEDRDVARLRERFKARKMPRKQVTRAEFGRLLIAEVKRPRIEVHVPELHIQQPVAKAKPSKQADAERIENGDPGIDPGTDGLTVKGEKATRQQVRNAEAILDEVQNYPEAPQRAVVALLCAIIQESVMGTAGMKVSTDGDSIGWLQARTSYISRDDALDLAYNVRRFFKEPWTGTSEGGAIAQARAGRSVGDITTSIQGNATGDVYTQWKGEALKWIEAYEGGGGRIDGERTVRKPYQYERKPKENTWDCLGRLFNEVNWRRFMRGGKVWIISEDRLFRQKPAMRLRPGKGGVDFIDFDLDMGSRDQLQEITVTGRAGLNAIQPGQVAIVEKRGPANGRWLVSTVTGKFGDDAITVTLRKPMAKKPEPAAATKTVGSGSDLGLTEGADRMVKWAKATLGTTEGSARHQKWAADLGYSTDLPWCSIWVAYGLKNIAGMDNLPPNPAYSGNWLTWSGGEKVGADGIQPGDLIVFDWGDGGQTDHVALYVGNGQRIGGNESNRVSENDAELGSAVGIIRPNYRS